MTLESIRDALQRRFDGLDCDESENGLIVITHQNSNCSVCVKLDEENVGVLMEKDDAMQIRVPVSLGRMSVSSASHILRACDSDGNIFSVRVSRAGRTGNGIEVVKYVTPVPRSNSELDQIVMLIVAVFNKAAERFQAA